MGETDNLQSNESVSEQDFQMRRQELPLVDEELRAQNEDLIASRAESEKARAKYRELFDEAPDGYIVTNSEGAIQEANQAAGHLFGCGAEELSRYRLSDLLPGIEQAGSSLRPSSRVFPRSGWEGLVFPLNGSPFWAAIRASASCDEAGQIISLRWLIRDISEQKKSEEALRDSESRLETLTAQLRELATELTLAEQRERQRIARLLHDEIQQFLVAAKMQTSLLLNRQPSKDLEATVKVIYDTLGQTLSASRILTAEVSPPVLYDIGLGAALQWLSRLFYEKHGLVTDLFLDPLGEPKEENVRIFLFDAIREILLNVIKHSGIRKARVEVVRNKEERVQTVISDEGKGFNPVQVRSSDVYGGIGLFSIQQRLQHIGGKMTIDSAPGRGTRIVLTCPKLQEPGLKSRESGLNNPDTDLARDCSKTGKIRVLLADDHHIIRQGLATLLRIQPDIEIIGEASNGEEAVNLSRALRPDVVVMDLSMPVMSGIEATAEIRRDLPKIQVVGLSVHEEGELSSSIREAGAVAYVTKGGPPEALVSAIHKAAAL